MNAIGLIIYFKNAALFVLIQNFAIKPECEIFDSFNSIHADQLVAVGTNIKKVRTTKGISQQAFADLFALTRGNISSYEENRAEPKIETVIQIANHFNIPLNQFITQNLSIHEILKYNGDKLIEEGKHAVNRQLKQVPIINDAIYLKCHYQELSFNDIDSFPKIILPEINNHSLLALSFNPTIPCHESLPHYQMNDVLIFEEVTRQNIHLCQGSIGLFTAEREIFIGRFEMNDDTIDLVVNDFTRQRLDLKLKQRFWKMFALYQHVYSMKS